MAVILPNGHPAIEILQQENANVTPASSIASDAPRIRVAIANTMSNVIETETQFARAFADSDQDIELVFFSPSTKLDAAQNKLNAPDQSPQVIEREQHRLAYHKPLTDIQNDPTISGIVLTGFPAATLPLRQKTTDQEGVDFYNEFTDLLDHAQQSGIPTLATCWSSHVALNHFYGIERNKRDQKLTGTFNVEVSRTNSILTDGLDKNFPLPVSRYFYSDEEGIKNEANLNVLVTSKETGAAIVSENQGSFVYMTGHLEYLAETLPQEYIRDLYTKGMFDAVYPRNIDLHNQQRTWAGANTTFYNNIAAQFAAFAADHQQDYRQAQPADTNVQPEPAYA